MKDFAILTFLLIGTAMGYHVNEKWHPKYVQAASDVLGQCGKELNVNPDIIYRNLGIITDGKFVKENAFKVVDEVHKGNPMQAEALKKIVTNCGNKVHTVKDACIRSITFIECYYTEGEKVLN